MSDINEMISTAIKANELRLGRKLNDIERAQVKRALKWWETASPDQKHDRIAELCFPSYKRKGEE